MEAKIRAMDELVPDCVGDRLRELKELCEKYPISIPSEAAAEFLHTEAENLKFAVFSGQCRFGYGWKRHAHGNRAFLIPTAQFWLWYTARSLGGGGVVNGEI